MPSVFLGLWFAAWLLLTPLSDSKFLLPLLDVYDSNGFGVWMVLRTRFTGFCSREHIWGTHLYAFSCVTVNPYYICCVILAQLATWVFAIARDVWSCGLLGCSSGPFSRANWLTNRHKTKATLVCLLDHDHMFEPIRKRLWIIIIILARIVVIFICDRLL